MTSPTPLSILGSVSDWSNDVNLGNSGGGEFGRLRGIWIGADGGNIDDDNLRHVDAAEGGAVCSTLERMRTRGLPHPDAKPFVRAGFGGNDLRTRPDPMATFQQILPRVFGVMINDL